MERNIEIYEYLDAIRKVEHMGDKEKLLRVNFGLADRTASEHVTEWLIARV